MRWKVSDYALAEVPQWAVRSICFFVFAEFSRAESPEGGGACPWQPPLQFQSTPGTALLVPGSRVNRKLQIRNAPQRWQRPESSLRRSDDKKMSHWPVQNVERPSPKPTNSAPNVAPLVPKLGWAPAPLNFCQSCGTPFTIRLQLPCLRLPPHSSSVTTV